MKQFNIIIIITIEGNSQGKIVDMAIEIGKSVWIL